MASRRVPSPARQGRRSRIRGKNSRFHSTRLSPRPLALLKVISGCWPPSLCVSLLILAVIRCERGATASPGLAGAGLNGPWPAETVNITFSRCNLKSSKILGPFRVAFVLALLETKILQRVSTAARRKLSVSSGSGAMRVKARSSALRVLEELALSASPRQLLAFAALVCFYGLREI